ncbi:MAG: sulfatase-like hydrolase/transferase [Terriglobia bacterium]
MAAKASASDRGGAENAKNRPNILIIIADQFRWDFVGAYGLNPMGVTPNLDSMTRRGVAFQNAVTNQPLCSPSRACLFTGQYATQTGVWKLGPGLRPGATTLATVLRSHGYTANYIGKWHLMENGDEMSNSHGYVPPEYRGGFLDLWEAANETERTTHPYEGVIWNRDGKLMEFKGVYRVDYFTQLAVKFLRQPHQRPFLLVVSQLEPHNQNDQERPVPPRKYAGKYANPFVPRDLRPFAGVWQDLLPSYYGDIKAIDDSVGVLLKTLSEQGLAGNTIVVMLSDHGNHFFTRTHAEYKCTPHESSIHIPLLMQGPGFNHAKMIPEVVSMVDVAPSLLDAAGVPAPDSMQGRSFFPLLSSPAARARWRQEAFIQISESEVGRALRNQEWTYCAIDPTRQRAESSESYEEYQLYNLASDPHQLLNLAGRYETRAVAQELRERLIARITEAGEDAPSISPRRFYP